MSQDYKIKAETLLKWLRLLYQMSESETLDNAIIMAKMSAQTDEEIEVSRTIALLFRAECSGEIDPPIKMRFLYSEIVKEELREAC